MCIIIGRSLRLRIYLVLITVGVGAMKAVPKSWTAAVKAGQAPFAPASRQLNPFASLLDTYADATPASSLVFDLTYELLSPSGLWHP
jgi:hypothetical protein